MSQTSFWDCIRIGQIWIPKNSIEGFLDANAKEHEKNKNKHIFFIVRSSLYTQVPIIETYIFLKYISIWKPWEPTFVFIIDSCLISSEPIFFALKDTAIPLFPFLSTPSTSQHCRVDVCNLEMSKVFNLNIISYLIPGHWIYRWNIYRIENISNVLVWRSS